VSATIKKRYGKPGERVTCRKKRKESGGNERRGKGGNKRLGLKCALSKRGLESAKNSEKERVVFYTRGSKGLLRLGRGANYLRRGSFRTQKHAVLTKLEKEVREEKGLGRQSLTEMRKCL